MSQSDYIRFKKTSRLLKDPADFNPVFAPSEYISGKEYNLETTVPNTKQTNNQLTPTGSHNVFGMDIIAGCTPTFILCTGTNMRENRRALDASQSECFPVMKAPGRSVPPMRPTLLKDSQFLKPNFNSYVKKNYRIRCEYKDKPCVGTQSRVCRMKYGCTCN
jgi:hypothetical protein